MQDTAEAPTRPRTVRDAKTVHGLVERWVRRTPEACAVECGDVRLTYAALNAAANRLARRLHEHGIDPGDNVGICAGRSIDLVVALLAVLKAGGSYVALDPRYPRERHQVMVADAGIAVLLTEQELRPDVEGLAKELLLIDGIADDSGTDDDSDLNLSVPGENPAYVAYTSGSTGKPKGVVVPHRAVVRLVEAPSFLRIGPDDAVLHFAPVAFDASTLEIWTPLAHGARLVVFPAHEPSLDDLAETVQRTGVTIMWLTAGLFHQMVDGPLERLAGVRQLLAGGDVLSVAHVNKALSTLPSTAVINGYGPTENTTFTSCHVMTAPISGNTVPIGRAITGTRVYVLDEDLRPVPDGTPGELYTGGLGLAHGYLGQPGNTAERFVPDPFGPWPGARLYRTGDLVRRQPDGVVEFLGRVDNQIKIRGFRVEPGEIETVLLAVPGVRDAAVVDQEHPRAGRRLVAFVVCDDGVSVPEVRRRLAASLPSYLVPAAFVRLAELPLNRNGKVDRSVLRAHVTRQRPELGSDYRAPQGDIETSLAAMWADLMEIDEVGVGDDFFELGGHSLMAVQIAREITAVWDVEIGPRQFYANPTVAELARTIEELRP